MTKELEALEKIKKIEIYKEEDYYNPDDERTIGLSGYEYQGTVEEEYANEIEIIEAALIDYQNLTKPKEITGTTTLNKTLEQFLIDSCPDIDKKLKALEIIKEKKYSIGKDIFVAEERTANNITFYDISEKEIELLKEVLIVK